MTPFQAIRASFYMLLAKAREPLQERELAPASPGATHRSSTTSRSSSSRRRAADAH
jgi:hypothetical protein